MSMGFFLICVIFTLWVLINVSEHGISFFHTLIRGLVKLICILVVGLLILGVIFI